MLVKYGAAPFSTLVGVNEFSPTDQFSSTYPCFHHASFRFHFQHQIPSDPAASCGMKPERGGCTIPEASSCTCSMAPLGSFQTKLRRGWSVRSGRFCSVGSFWIKTQTLGRTQTRHCWGNPRCCIPSLRGSELHFFPTLDGPHDQDDEVITDIAPPCGSWHHHTWPVANAERPCAEPPRSMDHSTSHLLPMTQVVADDSGGRGLGGVRTGVSGTLPFSWPVRLSMLCNRIRSCLSSEGFGEDLAMIIFGH